MYKEIKARIERAIERGDAIGALKLLLDEFLELEEEQRQLSLQLEDKVDRDYLADTLRDIGNGTEY